MLHNGSVIFAAHAKSDDILKIFVAGQAVAPKAGNAFWVGNVIPGIAVNGTPAPHHAVFLPAAHTGFVVGGAHHHTQFVRQYGVFQPRAVQAEIGIPHGRPQVVAFHAQQQLKYRRIAGGVHAAKMGLGPVAKGGPFIVDKKAAVLDGRHPGYHVHPIIQYHSVLVPRQNMVPVDQRGNADQLRKMEQPVNGAALVVPRNHQRGANARQGGLNDLEAVAFPFAPDGIQVKFARGFQRIQHGAVPDGTVQHGTAAPLPGGDSGGRNARHQFNILLYHSGNPFYTGQGLCFLIKSKPFADRDLRHSWFPSCFYQNIMIL